MDSTLGQNTSPLHRLYLLLLMCMAGQSPLLYCCDSMCDWFPREWPWLQLSSGFIYSSDEGTDRLCSHLAG